MKKLIGLSGKILASTAIAFCAWAQAGPLGDLEIRGDVRLTQASSGESMAFSNTTFAVFGGDRVGTGESPATLRLGSGATFAVGPHSEVAFSTDAGLVEAELVRGWLAYSLGAGDHGLRVNGSDQILTDRLGLVEVVDPANRSWRPIADAEPLVADSGLRISDGNIRLPCSDRNGCDRSRPRSISQ